MIKHKKLLVSMMLSTLLSLTFFVFYLDNRLIVSRIIALTQQPVKYLEFKSHCPICRNETIRLVKRDEYSYSVVQVGKEEGVEKLMYTVSIEDFEKIGHFTCDLFNVLRRGAGIKIHAFALFNGRSIYYNKLIGNAQNLSQIYPGWLIRVLHDDSIDKSIICELECARNTRTGRYLDNVDFCDVTQLPEKENSSGWLNANKTWSARYMHPMKYRWLPIGDRFVNVTTSRDTDGYQVEREADAVHEWFESGKYGHIMRDHLNQKVYMLGGAWGVYNARNRTSSDLIFNLVKNEKLARKYYNSSAVRYERHHGYGKDQDFLRDHVYPIVRDDVLVHDAYHCMDFDRLGKPWPTKRKGDCFVCSNWPACDPVNGIYHKCPVECRPKDHQDWEYC